MKKKIQILFFCLPFIAFVSYLCYSNFLPDPQTHTRSPQWQSCRTKFLKNNPVCAVCGSKEDLQVHHIKPFHKYPELELDPNNLITLCKSHHLLFGHLMDYKSYNTNVKEDAAIWKSKIANRPRD